MWGFLFACLTTRAVHVKTVPSTDASSCVKGVERFVSRRGIPRQLYGQTIIQNLRGKKLRAKIKKWNTINIATELPRRSIKWRLNTPSAPHQCGIWERLVHNFKLVLYTMLGTQWQVMNITVCLVENALN